MLKQMANHWMGYLKIRVTGYSPERFLNLCKNKQILLWGLEAKHNAYEMYISVRDFRKLKPILKKTRTKIVILEKYGTPFFFHKYRKRKVFFLGIFLCLFLIYGLSRFIWNIDIQGNSTITDEVLLEYLETQKVYHGMSRKQVDCEKISTNLRKKFDDVIWVSVSLEGCNIIIHVKENTDTFQVSQTEDVVETASDIVATADGVIVEMVTRSGVPKVKVGDVVKEGDVLVSGVVEVKNDAGEVIREDLRTSDADIFAEVLLPYEEVCETVYQVKEYTKERYKEIYLNCFGYYVSLGIEKQGEENYESSSKETQMVLNENFKLPIFYGERVGKTYEWVEVKRTRNEKEKILKEKLEQYCEKLEEEGIVLLEKKILIQEEPSGMRAKGNLKVKQEIGSIRKTIDF